MGMVNARVCYKRVVQLPPRAEVAIIGAGFAGAATAWALARRGVHDVIVLERDNEPGRYASGRSAGLGRQIAEDDDTTALAVRGAELTRQLPVWTASGSLLTFDDVALADEYLARAQRFRVAVEVVSREAVAARWPDLASLRIARAFAVPSDGLIDVRALLRELLRGVKLATDVAVTRVEPGKLTTNRGELAARVIVDASGAWAGMWTGDPPLLAFKRHVFVLEVAGTEPTMPWLWHLGAGEMYLRGEHGGVLVSPCDKARCEPGQSQEAARSRSRAALAGVGGWARRSRCDCCSCGWRTGRRCGRRSATVVASRAERLLRLVALGDAIVTIELVGIERALDARLRHLIGAGRDEVDADLVADRGLLLREVGLERIARRRSTGLLELEIDEVSEQLLALILARTALASRGKHHREQPRTLHDVPSLPRTAAILRSTAGDGRRAAARSSVAATVEEGDRAAS
jgi:glycine/D-amino acid oxidase-like deaminating enzyme